MMTLNFDIQTDEQKTNFVKVLDFVRRLKLPVRFEPAPMTKKEETLLLIGANAETSAYYAQLIDTLDWSNAHARGEQTTDADTQSIDDFLKELHTIAHQTTRNDHPSLVAV